MLRLGHVVGFVVGLACGAAGTFFGTKKYFEKKAEEKAEKEISEARATFAKLSKEAREGRHTCDCNTSLRYPPMTPERRKQYEEAFAAAAKRQEEEKMPFCEFVKRKRSYMRLLFEHGRDKRKDLCDFTRDVPFQISEQECGKIDFEQVVLTWLCDDSILCDIRDGEVYTELEELIGDVGCDILTDQDDLPDRIYIRNPALQFDFIIVVNKKDSYVQRFCVGGNADEETT